MRVSGHTLCFEGAPHDDQGNRISHWATTGGEGRARCFCGEISEILPSANQRKAWHREHKAQQQ